MNVPTIDMTETGKNITRLRKDAGVSVRHLQRILGFTTTHAIYRWERGGCLPSIDNLVILAAVLGVSIDSILCVKETAK